MTSSLAVQLMPWNDASPERRVCHIGTLTPCIQAVA